MKRRTHMLAVLLCCTAVLMGVSSTVLAAKPQASIGKKKYATLQEAVTRAGKGQTVKVLRNLNLKKGIELIDKKVKFTLDLNKHTLSNKGGNILFIQGSKGISIKNGTLKGQIYANSKTAVSMKNVKLLVGKSERAIELQEGGTLAIEKGSVKGQIRTDGVKITVKSGTFQADTPFYLYGGSLTVRSGKILGDYSGIEASSNSKVIIQGGDISSYRNTVSVSGSVKITGGTISAKYNSASTLITPGKGEIGPEGDDWLTITAVSADNVVMTGGKIVSAINGISSKKSITFEGGSLTAAGVGLHIGYSGKLTVSGGTLTGVAMDEKLLEKYQSTPAVIDGSTNTTLIIKGGTIRENAMPVAVRNFGTLSIENASISAYGPVSGVGNDGPWDAAVNSDNGEYLTIKSGSVYSKNGFAAYVGSLDDCDIDTACLSTGSSEYPALGYPGWDDDDDDDDYDY